MPSQISMGQHLIKESNGSVTNGAGKRTHTTCECDKAFAAHAQ